MLTTLSPMLAAISIQQLVGVIFGIIIVGLIFWLLWWLVDYCALPAPFNKIAKVLLAVCGVFLLIGLLMQLLGHPIVTW